MADKDKSTAALGDADQEAHASAVTPGEPAERSAGEQKAEDAEQKAEDAELERQKTVVSAVAKANKAELPKLGGPLMNPGLGR